MKEHSAFSLPEKAAANEFDPFSNPFNKTADTLCEERMLTREPCIVLVKEAFRTARVIT